MDERRSLSRRKLLHTLAGTGVIAAADLAWWDEPYIGAAQGLGRRAGTLPMERSRADAHRADELDGRALQPVAKGFCGTDRIRAAGAGAAEADQLDHRRQSARSLPGLGQLGRPVQRHGRGRRHHRARKSLEALCRCRADRVADRDHQRQDHLAAARGHARRHLLPHRPAERARPQGADAGLDLGRIPRHRQGLHQGGQEPVRLRHARQRHLGAALSERIRLRQRRRSAEGRQGGDQLQGSGRRACLVSRPRAQAQGHAAECGDRRLRRNRRDLRARRHQHVPAQFRLERPAEEERRRRQLRHAAAADRSGEEARLVLVLRDAHHVQGRQEQGRRLAIHELHARGRAEPEIQHDARPAAGAQVDPRQAGIRQRPGAGRLRATPSRSASSAPISPIPAGAARSTPTACR